MSEVNGNSSSTRHSGTVKWFQSEKGFGFITTADGKDVFVHYSAIKGTPKGEKRNLKEGQKVEFDLVQAEKGPKAEEVMVVG